MKKLLFIVAIVSAFFSISCKKIIDQKKRSILIDIVTSGHWYVTKYTENTAEVTNEFATYEFQFYENNTVDGITATGTTKGSWTVDETNLTITAVFPETASVTLKRLNYVWKIVDSDVSWVKSKTTTSTGENLLYLKKK